MGSYSSATWTDEQTELARPWPRFWARMFDLIVFSLPIGFLFGAVFPQLPSSSVFEGRAGASLMGVLFLPIVMILDAIVIAQFGTTPGKAIAGLGVANLDRSRLSFETSLKRNLLVYIKGLVLGLPLLCLAGYSSGYSAVKDSGLTSWDADTATRVFARSGSEVRTYLIGFLAVVALLLDRALAQIS